MARASATRIKTRTYSGLPMMPDEIFKINGYSIIRKDRVDYNHGGGVCTYIRDTIPFRPRPDLSHSTIECIWVTIRPSWLPRKVSRIAVATIYIPPSTTNIEINEFYDYLYAFRQI